jgi:transposase
VPTPKEFEQLQVLLMRLESLQQMERQESNRLENSRLDAQTRQEIQEHLQDLQIRIQTVKKRFHAHIEQHETLKEKCALLISLPGIAELSAARLKPIRITCYNRRYERTRNQETRTAANAE